MEGQLTNEQAMQVIGQLMSRTKAFPSTTPTTQGLYNAGGIFAAYGIKDPVISAVSLPQSTIAKKIPTMASMYANEIIGFITEATAGTGTEPAGPCDDPPTAGQFKTCLQALTFGRYSRQTQVYDLSSSGEILNRGINSELGQLGGLAVDHPLVPSTVSGGEKQLAKNAFTNAINALGVAILRLMGPQIWTGNPTNNNGGGGYKKFKGLNLLINTGYTDSVAGTACAALDSDVRNFGNVDIASNGALLVSTLTNMYRNLVKRAEDRGLAPAKWYFAMRWSAFMEITEVWPCSYLSYRCAPGTGSTQFLASNDQISMRDGMRNGRYLLIDGEQVPVEIDDFIAETRPDAAGAPGTYSSDIYLIPQTFAGNNAALYMDFFNFNGTAGLTEAARAFGVSQFYNVTDGGRFVIHNKPPNNFCVQLLALWKPRLVLLTPHLAGRLQNVKYTPVKHEVSPIIGEPSYVGGGVLTR